MKEFLSYVAIGDSLSEGLGDRGFNQDRSHCGWTDRLATLLSLQASANGQGFQFANLAIRGSGARTILGQQLNDALNLKPDLVTIMAGANDFSANSKRRAEIAELLNDGLARLREAGVTVVIANTICPRHLRIFKPLLKRSEAITHIIEGLASKFGVPILDVHRIDQLGGIDYWAQDMVHFSAHGHITVANRAAEVLGLDLRWPEVDPSELKNQRRSLQETLLWIGRDVVPFVSRWLRRTTSGVGIMPKYSNLVEFSPREQDLTSLRQPLAA